MLHDIGIFDEFFSTGYEDAELGLRAMLAGYRQIFAPGAVVRHQIGASIDKIRDLRLRGAVAGQYQLHVPEAHAVAGGALERAVDCLKTVAF